MEKREQQALRVLLIEGPGSIQSCLSSSRDLKLSDTSIVGTLGAATSSRSEIKTGTLHGVFTEDKAYAGSTEELLRQRIEATETLNDGSKKALLTVIEYSGWVEQMEEFKTKEEFSQFFENHGFYGDAAEKELWEKVAEDIWSARNQGRPILNAGNLALRNSKEKLDQLYPENKADQINPNGNTVNKRKLFQVALNRSNFVRDIFGGTATRDEAIKTLREKEKLSKKECQAINEFIEECATDVKSFRVARTADISLDRRTHLNERNVASSTLAELLGCGDVIVRAESASMAKKDKPSAHGMFMEFADGINGATAKGNQAVRQNTALLNNGNLKRQAADLQLLDCLCGQIDRHGNNIIFEQDPQTGAIIGLKGIDNDMAFGTSSVNSKGYHSIPMGMIRTVNQKTVDALDCLSQEVIEYRFQHLLSKEERDALWNRVDTFRAWVHTDQVKKVSEQEWEQMSWQDLAEGFNYTQKEHDRAEDPSKLENVSRLQNMFYRIGAVILPPNALRRKPMDHIKDRISQGYEFDSEAVKSQRISREAAVKAPKVPIDRTAAPTAKRPGGRSM